MRRIALCSAASIAMLGACVSPSAGAWARRGMVASEHRLASEAGVAMLRRGGNAVDAAVATALAVCVVNPTSCGIGGGGFMFIRTARSRAAVAIDYREVAPAAATRDMFVRAGQALTELSRRGGLAVAVPGEIAGLALASRRFGRLRWASLFAPAIRLARDGFPAGAHLAGEIAAMRDALAADPVLARNFLHADGTPITAGETLREPELAATLARIAREGPTAFYHGSMARQIVDAVQAHGGVITAADLAAYHPVVRDALAGTYRGYHIDAMPPPGGGAIILEILGILRHDDLRALERDSPTYIHLLAEAMQYGFADRAAAYGDPDFVTVPLHRLLAPQRLDDLRQAISAVKTYEPAHYGATASTRESGTSHLSVIDGDGNAVACTTTINTGFGSLVVAGETGIILNNEMDDFSVQPGTPNVYGLVGSDANAIAPGKRPLSSMSPMIVSRNGRAVMVVGASGGPLIISATLQTMLDVLDFDLTASEALAARRIHDQWVPPVLAMEPGFPPLTGRAVAAYGYTIKPIAALGAVQMVRAAGGQLEGAADPRKGGEAVGW